MAKTLSTVDRINKRIADAADYLRTYGWVTGTHGIPGGPADIRGALFHCGPRNGDEVVAFRMLQSIGYDTAWNDLICRNRFEAIQVMQVTFDAEAIKGVYGPNWYTVIGIFRLFTLAGHDTLHKLADHIGPAHEDAVVSLMERLGANPAYDDAHMVCQSGRVGVMDKQLWLMSDALVANALSWPDIDPGIAEVLAPVAIKLGLD